MALIRTDYGLIYNTNGNLCATLLPEGGVAVTEGTMNLAHGQMVYDNVPPVPVPGYPNATVHYGTTTLDCAIALDPQIQVHSVQAWVYISEDWDYGPWQFRFYRDENIVGMVSANMNIKGQWQFVKGTFSGSADRLQVRSSSVGTNQERWVAMMQVEAKPYRTPFVEGTRPAGILPYPELAKQFNQREFTFVAEWRPYSSVGTQLERIFQVDNGTADHGKMIHFWRDNNSRRLYLQIPNVDGTDTQSFGLPSIEYSAYEWQFVAAVLDVPNMKARIHLNDEYQEFPLTEVPAMLDLQRFFLGCVGTSGQLNGELKNVQIINEALPVEVINNF